MQKYSEEELLKVQQDLEQQMDKEDDFLQEIEKISAAAAS